MYFTRLIIIKCKKVYMLNQQIFFNEIKSLKHWTIFEKSSEDYKE